jgi:dTDP-4-dehydrorhamnose 3,5-epimerase
MTERQTQANMKIIATDLPGVVLIEPRVFEDTRGFFMETFHKERFEEAGLACEFVQDNHSHSVRGVLRGLHYQIVHPQGKLVRAVRGEIFDVAVDLRRRSLTFGRWFGAVLSESNKLQLYIPPHCAHGYCVLSECADVAYKCTDLYHPEYEKTILWNDPDLRIQWPVATPLVSEKDQRGLRWGEAPCFES